MAESKFSLKTQNSSRYDNSEYFVFASLLCVIMLLALFGNFTLIVTIHCRKSLRTRTNWFILNLACADLGVALFCMPFSIITCFSRDWMFVDSLCHLNGFLNILFEFSSLFTLTAISIVNYFSILKPMVHVITTRLAWIMVAMTWIFALILASVPLTGFIKFDFKAGSTQCGVQFPSNLGQTIFAFVVLLVAYLIPLCIMGFCYVNIFSAARKLDIRLSRMFLVSTDNDKGVSSQRQVAVTILTMFITFIVCWTPYFAYMTYMTAVQIETAGDLFIQNFELASYWCAFFNSCVDPFLYGLRNPLIRKELYTKCCSRFQNCTSWYNTTQRESTDRNTAYYKTCLNQGYGAWYLAHGNSVAFTEEVISYPNAGISKVTSDNNDQMGYPLQLLSIQHLCKTSFANEKICGGNQTLPRDYTMQPTLFQDTNLDHTWNMACSTRSSASSETHHVMNRGNEVTCSSEDFCSNEESTASVSSISRWSCEDGSCLNSCSSDSSVMFPWDANTNRVESVSFPSTKKRTEKFKIGWIECLL